MIVKKVRALVDFDFRNSFEEKPFSRGEVASVKFDNVGDFNKAITHGIFEEVSSSEPESKLIPVIPLPGEETDLLNTFETVHPSEEELLDETKAPWQEGTPEFEGKALREDPHPCFCVQHGGSPGCEESNKKHGFTCPRCDETPEDLEQTDISIEEQDQSKPLLDPVAAVKPTPPSIEEIGEADVSKDKVDNEPITQNFGDKLTWDSKRGYHNLP